MRHGEVKTLMEDGLWDTAQDSADTSKTFARFAYPSAVASSADQVVVVDNAMHSVRIVCGDVPSPAPVAEELTEIEDAEGPDDDGTESESNTESETSSESESESDGEDAAQKKDIVGGKKALA